MKKIITIAASLAVIATTAVAGAMGYLHSKKPADEMTDEADVNDESEQAEA